MSLTPKKPRGRPKKQSVQKQLPTKKYKKKAIDDDDYYPDSSDEEEYLLRQKFGKRDSQDLLEEISEDEEDEEVIHIEPYDENEVEGEDQKPNDDSPKGEDRR